MMKGKSRKWITIAILALSFVMIGLGIARGEAHVVLNKATTICMQCIGIQ